eukprot:403369395
MKNATSVGTKPGLNNSFHETIKSHIYNSQKQQQDQQTEIFVNHTINRLLGNIKQQTKLTVAQMLQFQLHPEKHLQNKSSDNKFNKLEQIPIPTYLLDQQYRRIFSKSLAYTKSQAHMNYGDGIIIPSTFLRLIMDKDQHDFAMSLYKKNLLIVRVSDTRTFFNVNMNHMYRKQIAQSDSNYQDSIKRDVQDENLQNNKHEVICHVRQITTDENSDSDCVIVPQKIYEQLKCKSGDPLCVNLDLTFYSYECQAAEEISISLKKSKKVQISMDSLTQMIQDKLQHFKILKQGETYTIQLNKYEQELKFEIQQISPPGHSYYINSLSPKDLKITILNFVPPIIKLKQDEIDQENLALIDDIDELINKKGFQDLDLLEKALNKRHYMMRQATIQSIDKKNEKNKQHRKNHSINIQIKDNLMEEKEASFMQAIEFDKLTPFDKEMGNFNKTHNQRQITNQSPLPDLMQNTQFNFNFTTSENKQKNLQQLRLQFQDRNDPLNQKLYPSQSLSSQTIQNNKFQTVIKNRNEILNMKSLSIEFQTKLQNDQLNNNMMISRTQNRQLIKQIIDDSLPVQGFNISQRHEQNNSSVQNEDTILQTNESFCNSYYGRLLNRKLQELDVIKVENDKIQKQTLAKRKEYQRPLTQARDTRDSVFHIRKPSVKRNLKQPSIQDIQTENLKVQMNQMAIKRGKLPMSTPGQMSMMFQKYKRIIQTGQNSVRNSVTQLEPQSQQASYRRNFSTSRPKTGSTLRQDIVITQPKLLNQKDIPVVSKPNFSSKVVRMRQQLKNKVMGKRADSDFMNNSYLNAWGPQQTVISEKSHLNLSQSQDGKIYKFTQQNNNQNSLFKQQNSVVKVKKLLSDPNQNINEDFLLTPNKSNNQNFTVVAKNISSKSKHLEKLDIDQMDYDQMGAENSTFKYMFNDMLLIGGAQTAYGHSPGKSSPSHFSTIKDPNQIHLKTISNVKNQQQQWQMAKINNLNPRIIINNKKRPNTSQATSNRFKANNQIIHQQNATIDTMRQQHITSPKMMLFKRRKNLKTLVTQETTYNSKMQNNKIKNSRTQIL